MFNLLTNFGGEKKIIPEKKPVNFGNITSPNSGILKEDKLDLPKSTSNSSKYLHDKLEDSKAYQKEDAKNPVINDSLERELFFAETQTSMLRSKEKATQVMQKMMKSNQRRNTLNVDYSALEASRPITPEPEKENSKEDVPIRQSHRSKNERENLQGQICAQCEKVL